MLADSLKTLYSFLGKGLLTAETQTKLEKEIFNKIFQHDDYVKILEFIKEIQEPEVSEMILNKLIKRIFENFNIVYDNYTLIYGQDKIQIKFDFKSVNELIEMIDLNDLKGENLFRLFSDDLSERLKGFRESLNIKKAAPWTENELNSYIRALKPLTVDFLKLLVKNGRMNSDEIVQNMELKSNKSISALVSATIRNMPLDKEKIVLKENDYIKINDEYRDIVYKMLFNE